MRIFLLHWNVVRSQQHKRVFHTEWTMLVSVSNDGINHLVITRNLNVWKTNRKCWYIPVCMFFFWNPKGSWENSWQATNMNSKSTKFQFLKVQINWTHVFPFLTPILPFGCIHFLYQCCEFRQDIIDTFGVLDANDQYCSKASFWNKFQTNARIEKTDGNPSFRKTAQFLHDLCEEYHIHLFF